MCLLINGLCKPRLGAPSHVTKMLLAENEQKVDEIEPIYLGKKQFWLKMICDFGAHYQLPFFGCVRSLQHEYCFSSFFLFFCFFFFFLVFFFFFRFLLRLSTFIRLNALYLKFERLKISGRTCVGLNSKVPSWENSSQSGLPKLWPFKALKLDGSNFRNG